MVAGNFFSSKFQKLLHDSGIFHQISFPYTPEQNGCAEHKHRHIVEPGLTLLFNDNMPTKFWPDAFLTATYLINRQPMRSLQFTSPRQKLFKHRSSYSTLKVFRCLCYP